MAGIICPIMSTKEQLQSCNEMCKFYESKDYYHCTIRTALDTFIYQAPILKEFLKELLRMSDDANIKEP